RVVGAADAPDLPESPQAGEALVWMRSGAPRALAVRTVTPRSERRRHVRKYAAGEPGEAESLHLPGPDGKPDPRAFNLMLFVAMGEGVDAETWEFHRRHGDYSRWFRESIKDADLAAAAARIEADAALDPAAARDLLRRAIEERYPLAV